MTDQTPKDEVGIACDPNAVPADKREHWVATGKQVYAAVREVTELPDGYQFRLPADLAMLLKVAEYIAHERLCCAFLRFTVEVEPRSGPVWLRLTGGEGVKEYIRSVFETNDLFTDLQVLKAASSPPSR